MFYDLKYQLLSRPKPNGQSLWHYLLFGPRTTIVPGLLPVDLGVIASDMRWPTGGTRKSWQEIAEQGMAQSDWEAPLIWLPQAPFHNPPESPNVVKAWRRAIDEDLPECRLLRDASTQIEAFLQDFGKGFIEAFMKDFDEALREESAQSETEAVTGTEVLPSGGAPAARSSPAHAVNGHAPEQLELRPPRAKAKKPATTPGDTLAFIKRFQATYAEHRRQAYGNPEAREWKHVKDMLAQFGAGRLWVMAERFIVEPSTEYPFNGARTLTELFAFRRLIEGRLIDAGILAPSAPPQEVARDEQGR